MVWRDVMRRDVKPRSFGSVRVGVEVKVRGGVLALVGEKC